MKKIKFITLVSLFLLFAISLNFTACSYKISAGDLMEGITPGEIDAGPGVTKEMKVSALDFALRLFKASEEKGSNTLISPLSVLAALSMTANGAKGNTLAEMEQTLGMSSDDLNKFFFSYMKALRSDEKNSLHLANSIWFTSDSRFTVNRGFLQTNADYYGADAYKAPFDNSTLKDINEWVKKNTDGMIPKILDDISADSVMFLVNALAFDAEWSEIYKEDQVHKGEFTTADGTKRSVDFMYSEESAYLSDERASGFIKYYKGGKYAFAAILPENGVDISDYISSLDGEKLSAVLSGYERCQVNASLPKFETEYDVEMSQILKNMGIKEAFDGRADFSGLGESTAGKIFISRVIHKTHIAVDERGTKAGAASAVEMTDGAAPFEPKKVTLDRPFIYMLIDTENMLPFFIGTMNDVGN